MQYDATNCFVYFNNKILLQGPRYDKTKLWIFPLWSNLTPTLSRHSIILKLSMTGQSKGEIINLTTQTFKTPNLMNLPPISLTVQHRKTWSSSTINDYFHHWQKLGSQLLTINTSLASQVLWPLPSNKTSLYKQQ